jgi:hypothetical protein
MREPFRTPSSAEPFEPWQPPRAVRRGWLAIALAILLVGGILVAMSGGTEKCGVEVTATGNVVCLDDEPIGDEPLDTHTRIDLSALRGDERLVAAYTKRTLQLADLTIDRGGTVTVTTYARSAARARMIFEARVPSLEELRLARRGAMEKEVRGKLRTAVENALAAGVPDDSDHGSDVVTAVATIGDVRHTPGAPLVAQALTDGKVNVDGGPTPGTLTGNSAEAGDRLLASLPPVEHRPTALAIAGIGATGGRLGEEDIQSTGRLVEVWDRVCPRVSDHCTVKAEL